MDAWCKLRAGQIEDALSQMVSEYKRDTGNPSAAIQIGVTYMWLGEWQRAWEHFRGFIENSSTSTDVMAKFAGVAKWCAGDRVLAIQQWKLGLDADYTDPSGGVTIPLHLYFAAAACPTMLSIAEMDSLIRQPTREQIGVGYPGLLARVALGELSSAGALREAQETDPHGSRQHPWKIAFWEGVHQLASGNKHRFLKQMSVVADLDWEDFDRSQPDFIDRIWSSEFFLARHYVVGAT